MITPFSLALITNIQKSNSQIYGQALDGNVCLLSWEHFAYFFEHNVRESKN